MSRKVTVTGEIFKFGKGLIQEMFSQVTGVRPKKKKKHSGDTIQIHYHFYRDKDKHKKPR